jgi:catechol 2,3-dioxygenase-like lactoylglutathione lyase family enzyme
VRVSALSARFRRKYLQARFSWRVTTTRSRTDSTSGHSLCSKANSLLQNLQTQGPGGIHCLAQGGKAVTKRGERALCDNLAVMLLPRTFTACLIVALPVLAQRPAPGTPLLSHIHINSSDPAVAIAFWKDVMGVSGNDAANGVSMIGATILFNRKAPSGPSAGSTLDHLALKIPDLQRYVEVLAKTPYKSFHPEADDARLMIDGPDGARVELVEDNTMFASKEFNHLHLYSTQATEMQAWYVKNLGGRAGTGENADTVTFPGAALRFAQAASVAPSADRAIDHIGFEVKDLDAFCKKLVADGAKLEAAPHADAEMKTNVAMLSDPWGTRLEFMERTTP